MGNKLITLRNVSKSFDDGRVVALRDISLEICQSEWISVSGRSGCGKSTLLSLLAGLDRPTKGEVYFEGEKPSDKGKWANLRATKIGFVFQAFNLLPTLTAVENVEIPMFGIERMEKRRRQHALKLLEQVGLVDRCVHYPNQLSGGERQRVAIARALANNPRVIIADEPTGNLDSSTSAEIVRLFKDIHETRNTTMIVVSHEPDIAKLGDRIVVMHDGQIADVSDSS